MEPHCCDTSISGRIYVIMCGCNISTAILEYEKILDISIFEKKSGDSVSTSTAPPPWWVILVAGSASLSVKPHDIGLNILTKMTEGTRTCQNDKKILPGIPLKMESLLDRSTIMNLTRARCAHPALPSTHTHKIPGLTINSYTICHHNTPPGNIPVDRERLLKHKVPHQNSRHLAPQGTFSLPHAMLPPWRIFLLQAITAPASLVTRLGSILELVRMQIPKDAF